MDHNSEQKVDYENFMRSERLQIENLIFSGADVNRDLAGGISALHKATIHNYLDLIDALLQRGANVHARDGLGRTPLHYATGPEAISLLLSAGANAIAQDLNGFTPLHLAVSGKNRIMFWGLLHRTPNLNFCSTNGMTPLITAVNNAMEDVAINLLSAGADINAPDGKGMTALHWAVSNNCLKLVIALLQNKPILNIQDCNGCTPLHYANAEIAKALLFAGADTSVEDNIGQTPLHVAVIHSDMASFRLLLQRTVNLNTRHSLLGQTPLLTAMANLFDTDSHVSERMAINLITAGADVNAVDLHGKTVLHIATENNCPKLVKVLLENGAHTDLQDYTFYRNTPLHYAVISNGPEIAKMLIDAKANTGIQNNLGLTPLHAAVISGNTDLFELLLPHTIYLDTYCRNSCLTPLTNAVQSAMEPIVRQLINAGANVSVLDNRGFTALHLAADFSTLPSREGSGESRANIVSQLLVAGVDQNIPNNYGDTALHVVLKTEAWPILPLLFRDIRADLKAHNIYNGKTPLMTVLEKNAEEIFVNLIEAGASVHETDNIGRTALHYATELNKRGELKLLLDRYDADVNAADVAGNTALLLAAELDLEDAYKILVRKSNVDVNVQRVSDGKTLLMIMIESNPRVFDFQCMVKRVKNINATDRNLQTALHYTANFFSTRPKDSKGSDNSRANAARILLDAGADPNLQNIFGETALHTAVKTKALPVFQELLKDSRTNRNAHNKHEDDKTPMMMILEGTFEVEVFVKLIEAGASVHERDSKGRTALHYATKFGKCSELSLLLDKYGADVNAADEEGNTALLLAAELNLVDAYKILVNNSNVDINVQRVSDNKTLLMIMLESKPTAPDFQYLVEHARNINAMDKKLQTALHYAAKLDKYTELDLLIKHGAELNARDCEGQTPLFVAALEGNFQTCYNLMSLYDANRDIADNKDRKPVDVAGEKGHGLIVELFHSNELAN